MRRTVYFDPSVSARSFTSAEMAFVMAVLNDARAWGYSWALAEQRQTADWIVALEAQWYIDQRIAEHASPMQRKSATLSSGLSVTFMRESPRRSFLSLENWSRVPKPVARVYSIQDYRTYLVLHEC